MPALDDKTVLITSAGVETVDVTDESSISALADRIGGLLAKHLL